jgi:hypothetical protein
VCHLPWTDMRLNNGELHQLFTEKGIIFLNHANTVATSITYVRQGGLLSRGAVQTNGLNQSPQSSDELDKIFNVWNDVFLDTVDLHGYFPRQNYYGPVLFKLSVDLVTNPDFEIWVTKDNPINWTASMTDAEKYFISVEELRNTWDNYQRQKKMVTIRNNSIPILFNYIYEVLVDDPRVKVGEVVMFNEAVKGLKEALTINEPLKNKFKIRECNSCFCTANYLQQVAPQDLSRLFLPINN